MKLYSMMIIKIIRMETSKYKGTVDPILLKIFVENLKTKSAFQQKKSYEGEFVFNDAGYDSSL